jgi:hypothetical protein
MQKPTLLYKRFKKWFYRGPKHMGALRVPRFVGYQSVTLTALYWLNYFINTHLTLIGRIMILVGFLMLSYCLLDPYTFPMSYFGFSMVALYLINFFIGYIFKPRVQVKRIIPNKAICGISLPIQYDIRNNSILPCWDLKLDSIHYPGCRIEQVITIPTLPPQAQLQDESRISFKNRGTYMLPAVFAESAFPLGLWKWGRFGKGSREVRVMPASIDIKRIKLDFISGENDQDLNSGSDGAGMEFTSCREFRYGDNPKHIHWSSWAKTDTPIIREMSDEGRPAVSILFDNCHPVNLLTKYNDTQNNFEQAVSFLAGVSHYFSKQRIAVRNLMIGPEIHQFEGNNSKDIHNKILDKCCDLTDQRKFVPLELKEFTLNQIQETKGLIVILLNYDNSRRECIEKLINLGIPLKVFLLGKERPGGIGDASFISYKNLQQGSLGEL